MTNPTYEEHTSWWDVLCNISTGKITVSKDIDSITAKRHSLDDALSRNGAGISPEKNTDNEFMGDVMNAIQGHYGETAVRAKFQDYIFRFVRLTSIYEEQVYNQTSIGTGSAEMGELGYGPVFQDEVSKQRELSCYASRIEGWRQTISYKYYQKVIITNVLSQVCFFLSYPPKMLGYCQSITAYMY